MYQPQSKCDEPNASDSGSQAINETVVNLEDDELAPYVRVVRPTRISLTYDRME
jgi:hypothetical protein